MKDGIFVKKPEGEYGLSEDHFVIDCVCGVKKGSRFKDSDLEEVIQNRKIGFTRKPFSPLERRLVFRR